MASRDISEPIKRNRASKSGRVVDVKCVVTQDDKKYPTCVFLFGMKASGYS
jgi:hypothetical protein